MQTSLISSATENRSQRPLVEERFYLSSEFKEGLRSRPVDWGFGALSSAVYYRTYSRTTDDGRQERWADTVIRVVEGVMSIRKDWYVNVLGKRWDEKKYQALAAQLAVYMFEMKLLPPGRGLWALGTDFVYERGAMALQNCGFVEVRDSLSEAASWAMNALMHGVGVGFSTHTASFGALKAPASNGHNLPFLVPDSREGWVEAVRKLIETYETGAHEIHFDYSAVRPAGTPLRGFGGIASGPDPLEKAIERIRGYLDAYILKQTSPTRLIADTMNAIGACVVAGNIRRSAEIALGSPTDTEFLNLKNFDLYPERRDIAWMSNNSVVLSDREHFSLLPDIAERVRDNGEPGILNFINVQKYGRYGDRMEDTATGFNPCVAGETLVMTTNGPRRVDSLEGKPFWAVVDGKAFLAPHGSFQTGTKDLFRLTTNEGWELLLTENHQVKRADGSWTEAADLSPGDQIVLNNHRTSPPAWEGRGSWEDGYLVGALVGDGEWTKSPALKVWEKDEGSEGIAEEALRCAQTVSHRKDWAGWHSYGRGYSLMTMPPRWLEQFGLAYRNKLVGEKIDISSAEFHRGFLRGLFDTDGHIEGTREKGYSLRLSQSNQGTLQVVQRMLLRLGIKSAIYAGREAGDRALPDGKGGKQAYACKTSWRLVVGADSIPLFAETVGFSHRAKQEKLSKICADRVRGFYAKPFVATVEDLTFVRTDIVWDITVDDVHAFDANGLYVHNCAEQPLESHEVCCLVELFPTRCVDDSEIYNAMKLATFFASTVSLLRTHSPETNEVVMRNHRIGVSVSGIADWIDTTSVSHVFDVLNRGYENVVRPTNKALAKEAGVPESIRVTTVKPSGSISLLAGVSAGMHHPLDGYVLRRMRVSYDSPVTDVLEAAGVPSEKDVYSDNTLVFEFPLKYGNGKTRSVKNVSIYEQAAIVAMLQKAWADNAVSNTLTIQPHESGQVERVLALFAPQVKSLSLLPDTDQGVYEQMPLEKITKAEFAERSAKMEQLDWSGLHGSDGVDSRFCSNDSCEL